MTKKTKLITMVSLSALLGAMVAFAAPEATSITADELAYDGKSRVATATGNVVVTRGDQVMTGSTGWYNLDTSEAYLSGGVQMNGPDTSMSASEIHAYGKDEVSASGSVYLQKGNRSLSGSSVTYNLSSDYGTLSGGAQLVSEDATMTADHIEGWFKQIRAIGTGHVELHSEKHSLTATGGRIEYTQTPGENDGQAHLSGGAYAVQNGNTLQGEAFDIRLGDNSIRTQGRSTLVIVPK